jgi:hypothetical protein
MRWIEYKNRGSWKSLGEYRIERRDHELFLLEGNEEGLIALRDAIDRALTSKNGSSKCDQYDSIGGLRKINVIVRNYDPDRDYLKRYGHERPKRVKGI